MEDEGGMARLHIRVAEFPVCHFHFYHGLCALLLHRGYLVCLAQHFSALDLVQLASTHGLPKISSRAELRENRRPETNKISRREKIREAKNEQVKRKPKKERRSGPPNKASRDQ